MYTGQWCLSPLQSRYLGTSHSLPIAISCPVIFSWISSMIWNLFPFKGDFSFGEKPEVEGRQIWAVGCCVPWVIWCFTKNLCMRRDAWMGMLLWWSRQPPAAHSCSLWNHLNSFHGGMFEPNAKYDEDSLIYSLSRFECRSHRVNMFIQQHLPPLLTSTVILSLFTHACLSPLSLAARLHQCEANHSRYINNGWIFFG